MGAELPRISIGMPTYNGAHHIRKAIDSILGQSVPDIELIISDNASTDGTEAICREYASRDARVHYFRQNENRGAYFNYDFVLKRATADLFMWAADDDVRDSNWLEVLSPHLTGGAVLAFGHIASINDQGEISHEYAFKPLNRHCTIRLIQYFLREEGEGKANLIYGLFKRNILLSHTFNAYFDCRYGIDMHYVFDLLQDGTVVIDNRTTHYPRIYPRVENRVSPSNGEFRRNSRGLALVIIKLRHVFLLDALKYLAVYPRIARGALAKTVLIALLPLKYAKSVFYNLNKLAIRRLRLSGHRG